MTAPRVCLSWTLEDAEEVAAVLRSAAIDTSGRVRDRGFYLDAIAIQEQIDAARGEA